MNPFEKLGSFLTNQVVEGLLNYIVFPVSAIGMIVTAVLALILPDEHQKEKFKKAFWFTMGATIISYMTKTIVAWLKSSFM